MKQQTEVKSAFDELSAEQREAVLYSAQLAQTASAWNDVAQKAYREGRLAPSNPNTAH
jgi:hypothetical protein